MPVIRGEARWRAEDVLRGFFGEQRAAASGRRLQRLQCAEADLRGCLEAAAPRLLEPHELALAALERQFDPEHVVARVAGAEVLLLLLPIFLDDPHWHGADVEDRKLRIRLAEPLAERIVRLPGIGDVGRAAWLVDAAVRHEVWLLRQELQAARRS